ncbi:ATP-citrate synthase alpha chain protein 2 [Zea mays]|uniref:ATP-citrate synthase alpha chain protein 2 n=1 Tax=Zea mays TaxID=4577 RepID=A0A3L6FKJ9_MAIZE|nr:ATP-citrate synthase alpha chain protein 2 [Zea mays]
MARKKIREYDSKRLLREHLKRLAGIDLQILSAQVGHSFPSPPFPLLLALLRCGHTVNGFTELANQEPWLSSMKLVVKPDMLFGKRGKSGLVALNLDLAQVRQFVKERLGVEVRTKIGGFIRAVFSVSKMLIGSFADLDFSFLEMNPFTLVNGEPYPLDMRGELDDTAAFKNFNKWGNIVFPLPFGRVLSPPKVLSMNWMRRYDKCVSEIHGTEPKGRIWTMVAGGGASVIYADTVGDLGYASELGNYAEYSGAPKEEEVLQYARVLLDCATSDPDGRKRALLIGGGIANFTDVASTFSGIIRALREKESKLKAARMNIYVRRGGPNYQTGLAKMRTLGAELGVPIEVYGPEATMTGICKEAIDCIMAA